jgi:hypothetical protein
MSTKELTKEQFEAGVSSTRLQFYKKAKIRPCNANDALLVSWMDSHNLLASELSNWNAAYAALGEKVFVPKEAEAPATLVQAAPVTPATAPQVDPQERLSQLRRNLRSLNPAVVAAATSELQKIAKAEKQAAIPAYGKAKPREELPGEYTSKVLRTMTNRDLYKQLCQRYGNDAVTSRLNQKEGN